MYKFCSQLLKSGIKGNSGIDIACHFLSVGSLHILILPTHGTVWAFKTHTNIYGTLKYMQI